MGNWSKILQLGGRDFSVVGDPLFYAAEKTEKCPNHRKFTAVTDYPNPSEPEKPLQALRSAGR
jgi:hypothetical protein